MKRHLALLISLSAVVPAVATVAEGSWIFRPSRYSHATTTGRRVNQYAPKKPSYVRADPTYFESGYRHMRSTIRGADGSADRLHIVQTWGAGEAIRPYGEWLFPFRAGATPYGPWGNPQGPWTMPFDSWINPYGLWNRYPYSYWGYGYDGLPYPPHASPYQAPQAQPHGTRPGHPHAARPGPSHGQPRGAPQGHPRGAPHTPPPGHQTTSPPGQPHGGSRGHRHGP